jgi:hypothetical protein
MQTVSANFLAAVQGSNTPVFYADLWKDNNLVGTLPLEQGSNSVDFDADSDVQASCTLVVNDPDGTWSPTSIGSPLTPFGSVINVRAGFDLPGNIEETVSLGWFVVNDVEIEEAWKSYQKGTETVLARKGARITVTGSDLFQKIVDYKFLVPTSPTETTAWAEIQTLVDGVIGYETPSYAGFTDVTIPSTLTYGDDRMQAVKDLAAVLAAEPVLTPGGKLTLRQINPAQDATNTAPTFGWNINVTEYRKKLSRDGVYNIVVARGRNSNNVDIVAYAIQSNGPTSFYSAIGPRPIFYDTDLLTTPATIQAYADAQLATLAQRNTQQVPITALPNPAIQLGDYANLTVQGSASPVTCRVASFTYNDVGEMSVSLTMPQNWIA